MCGRYANSAEFSEIRTEFRIERVNFFRPYRASYNISPSYGPGFEQIIVVRAEDGAREALLARWWLIPAFWQKPLKNLPTSFNARAEDVNDRAFFRRALKSQRCLVPATGWREFVGKPGKKQPYHFHLQRQLFAFAGLWSQWVDEQGHKVLSFAIITTEANRVAKVVHPRMPLVLARQHHDAWLDAKTDARALLAQACAESSQLGLDVYASNPIANKPGFEGPEAEEPVDTRFRLTSG
jgi:putative SOS response-associated peptidase YedK